jgi:hypothetical protein
MVGSYLRPDDLRVAVEVAIDTILRELREPDYYRDRSLRFSRGFGLSSGSSRLSDLELEEYIQRYKYSTSVLSSTS